MGQQTSVLTKFAAVGALDIAGYSRLMELDEAETFARVRTAMDKIVATEVTASGGRIVKYTGDGALVEWPDPAAAVACALQIQSRNETQERERRPDRRARFRVGLHAGNVIAADGDIFGDDVNIAARLEGIAGVGEVYVSDAITGACPNACTFLDLGQRRLKNIARPIRVFRAARTDDERAGAGATGGAPELYVQGFGDRPAIAVLPFKETGVTENHFADGITEGVINALAQWQSFPIISRNSVFALNRADMDLRMVGQQLGVRYVMEGSIRRGGDRLRATISLVDVDTDTMLLSETYECGPGDVFEMQDLIVHNIVGTLEPQLLHYERERVVKRPPPNPNAYELTQIGVWHHLKYTQDSSIKAREALTKALEIEPRNVQALTTLSISMTHAANVGWVSDPDETRMAALHFAEQVVEIAPRDPNAHFALGLAYQNLSRPADAAERYQRAIRLNPSHASAHANLGFVYCFLNRPDEGLPEIELAMRLSPSDPRRFLWIPSIAVSHYLAGRHRAALAAANEALRINPSYPVALRYTAAILGVLGRVQEARPIVEMVRRIDGGLEATARHLRRSYAEPAASIVLDGLRRAGLD